jgi:hypothetical protein
MIVFWTEEEFQKEIEEKENQACKELILQLIKQLKEKKEFLHFIDKDEWIEGVDVAEDVLMHKLICYLKVK